MPFPIAAAIAGGASLLGGIFGRAGANRQQNRAHAQNIELAQFQHDRNVEQWNRQNDYNSPSKTMERLKAAGLNPNMVYGSGQATTPASTLASYNSPTRQATPLPPIGIGEALGQFMQVKQAQAAVKQTEAVTKNIQEEAGIAALKKAGMEQALKDAGLKFSLDQQFSEGERYTNLKHKDFQADLTKSKWEYEQTKEFKEARRKKGIKAGKLPVMEEFLDALFQMYPQLKGKGKGQMDKIIRFLFGTP